MGDLLARRVQIFTSAGDIVGAIPVTGVVAGTSIDFQINDIAIGRDTTLYVVDDYGGLRRYSPDGSLLVSMSGHTSPAALFPGSSLTHVRVSPHYVYVEAASLAGFGVAGVSGVVRLDLDLTNPFAIPVRDPLDASFQLTSGAMAVDCHDSVFVVVAPWATTNPDTRYLVMRGFSASGVKGSTRYLGGLHEDIHALAPDMSGAYYYMAQYAHEFGLLAPTGAPPENVASAAPEGPSAVVGTLAFPWPTLAPALTSPQAMAIDSSSHIFVADQDRVIAQDIDADRDDISDGWEVYGIQVPGPNGNRVYHLPGADPRRREIFVEMDALHRHDPSQTHALSPRAVELDSIAMQRFAGVTLRVQRDELFEGPDISWDTTQIAQKFTAFKAAHFGSKAERDSGLTEVKRYVFRYLICGHGLPVPSRPNATGLLGEAELNGNDMVVALGLWSGETQPHPEDEAGVFLHELGHTLGLYHGGNQDVDRKPNYISVMNGAYVTPRNTSRARRGWEPRLSTFPQEGSPDFLLDESDLDETQGIGGAANGLPAEFQVVYGPPDTVVATGDVEFPYALAARGINWDRQGGFTTSVSADINAVFNSAPRNFEMYGSFSDPVMFQPSTIRHPLLPWRGPDDYARRLWREEVGLHAGSEGSAEPELPADELAARANTRHDCNANGIEDDDELDAGSAEDLDGNGQIDECDYSRVVLGDSVVVACPGADAGVLLWQFDVRGMKWVDAHDPSNTGFMVINAASGTIHVWDMDGGPTPESIDGRGYGAGDTVWAASNSFGQGRLTFMMLGASGCGQLVGDYYVNGRLAARNVPAMRILSVDQDSHSIGTVDRFDLAILRAAFNVSGVAGCQDFDQSGALGSGDSVVFLSHVGHRAVRRVVRPNGGESYAWGEFVPISWRRGYGDSALVRLELLNEATGNTVTLSAATPDDGYELWPAYVADAPGSQYRILVTHLAGSGVAAGSDASNGVFAIAGAQGGGCPVVSVLTSSGWQDENTILGRSLSSAQMLDGYRLRRAPTLDGGRIRVRVTESEHEFTTLDQVRLIALDHSAQSNSFAVGERVYLGSLAPALRVLRPNGADVTGQLAQSGYVGDRGDTLVFELPRFTGGPMKAGQSATLGGGGVDLIDDGGGKAGPAPIAGASVGRAEGPRTADEVALSSSGIIVEAPDGNGLWREISHYYPRERPDVSVIDTVGYDQLRLVFVGRHSVRTVGRLVPSGESLRASKCALVSATHSRHGDVMGAVSELGNVMTDIAPGDTLELTFQSPPADSGTVRDLFLLSKGAYTSNLPAGREESGHRAPPVVAVRSCTPNPFSMSTSIEWSTSADGPARLAIYDLQGRLVRTLTQGFVSGGSHRFVWNRATETGTLAPPGVYLCRLEADGQRAERKLLLLP